MIINNDQFLKFNDAYQFLAQLDFIRSHLALDFTYIFQSFMIEIDES